MASTSCPFCQHSNPEGSRFCNDCGAPLYLTPCGRCEAVNDRGAKSCYRCGAPLHAPLNTIETASASSANQLADGSPSVDSFTPVHAAPESAVETLDVIPRASHAEATEAIVHSANDLAHETRMPDLAPTPAAPLSAVVPLSTPIAAQDSHRRPGVALSVALVVAAAASSYYVYLQLTQSKSGPRTPRADPNVSVAAEPASVAQPTVPVTIEVPAAPTPEHGGAGAASAGPIANAASTRAAREMTAAPSARIDTRASRPDHAGSAAVPMRGTRSAPAEATPTGAGAMAGDAAREAARPAASSVDAALPRSSRTAPPPSFTAAGEAVRPRPAAPVTTAPESPRVSVCTEAVAALGLCNLSPQRESQ